MKKAFKITLFALLLCGIVSAIVCYIVIPQETKSAFDIVVGYLNQPLGVALGSTITIGGVLFVLLKYTTFGKVALNKLSKAFEDFKQECSKECGKAQELYDKALVEKEKQIEILSSYKGQIDVLTNELIKVCETSPNAKIKSIGEEIKEHKNNFDAVVSEIKNKLDDDFKTAMETRVVFDDFQKQLDELTQKLERLGSEDGEESKETIDSESVEE